MTWLQAKTAIWWITRVVMVIAGVAWLVDAFQVAFGGEELSQLEQAMSAFGVGFALVGGFFTFEKPK